LVSGRNPPPRGRAAPLGHPAPPPPPAPRSGVHLWCPWSGSGSRQRLSLASFEATQGRQFSQRQPVPWLTPPRPSVPAPPGSRAYAGGAPSPSSCDRLAWLMDHRRGLIPNGIQAPGIHFQHPDQPHCLRGYSPARRATTHHPPTPRIAALLQALHLMRDCQVNPFCRDFRHLSSPFLVS
jgi:hypothetical protein